MIWFLGIILAGVGVCSRVGARDETPRRLVGEHDAAPGPAGSKEAFVIEFVAMYGGSGIRHRRQHQPCDADTTQAHHDEGGRSAP